MLHQSRVIWTVFVYIYSICYGLLFGMYYLTVLVGRGLGGQSSHLMPFWNDFAFVFPYFGRSVILFVMTIAIMWIQRVRGIKWGLLSLGMLGFVGYLAVTEFGDQKIPNGSEAWFFLILSILYGINILHTTICLSRASHDDPPLHPKQHRNC